MSRLSEDFPHLNFREHVAQLQWRQGEHVFIAGPTGSGKTTLASSIIERRGHVVMFGTKVFDPTIQKQFPGWSIVQDFSEIERWMNRVIIWPRLGRKGTGTDLLNLQRAVYKDAFSKLLRARNWCIYLDELKYMADPKFGGVGTEIEMLHYTGRSAGMSIISAAQRPAFVPLAVLSNASHAYIARTKLGSDAKRLAEMGNVDPKELARVVASLPSRHDFVYTPTLGEGRAGIVNTRR